MSAVAVVRIDAPMIVLAVLLERMDETNASEVLPMLDISGLRKSWHGEYTAVL
jgi:hypothetical protein